MLEPFGLTAALLVPDRLALAAAVLCMGPAGVGASATIRLTAKSLCRLKKAFVDGKGLWHAGAGGGAVDKVRHPDV